VLGVAALVAAATGSAQRLAGFSVAPGATRLVVGDLDVTVPGDIDIAGRLLVARGAAVRLRAGGRLTISGSVVSMPARSVQDENPPANEIGLSDVYQGSKSVEISGLIRAAQGHSVKIASAEFGTVTVTGTVIAGNGRAGVGPASDGQDGGGISAGGYFGRNERTVIARGAMLRAGAGGRGFSHRRTAVSGNAVPNSCQAQGSFLSRRRLALSGSDAGKGGSIRLMGNLLRVGTTSVVAGAGGAGGDAGGPRVHAANGPKGRGGVDLDARSGDGGNGGSMILDTKQYLGQSLEAASGGDAGDVSGSAGNGATGCDGGWTRATLGKPGKNGQDRGLEALPAKGEPRAGAIELANGGLGGSAEDPDHAAGDGGRVVIAVPTAKRRLGVKAHYFVRSVELSVYANGGFGYDGCPVDDSKPSKRGTDGGAGGQLVISPIPYDATTAFLGRNGGGGDPPGDGGRAGTHNHPPAGGKGSFLAGPNGRSCNAPTGSGTIARGGCDDPHCVTVTVTFDKPFHDFRIQLAKGYGEANIQQPTIGGAVAGECRLAPLGDTVTTVCHLDKTAAGGTEVSFVFQGIKLDSDAGLPDGLDGDLYWLPNSAEIDRGIGPAGPLPLVGP
jgi:hypothetical protein